MEIASFCFGRLARNINIHPRTTHRSHQSYCRGPWKICGLMQLLTQLTEEHRSCYPKPEAETVPAVGQPYALGTEGTRSHLPMCSAYSSIMMVAQAMSK